MSAYEPCENCGWPLEDHIEHEDGYCACPIEGSNEEYSECYHDKHNVDWDDPEYDSLNETVTFPAECKMCRTELEVTFSNKRVRSV